MSGQDHEHGGGHEDVAVAVITPSGIFPGEELLQRVDQDTPIGKVLKLAQEALHLTNTGDWVVSVGERQLKPEDTFKKAGLRCVVDLEWHKPEGGGGA